MKATIDTYSGRRIVDFHHFLSAAQSLVPMFTKNIRDNQGFEGAVLAGLEERGPSVI